LIAKRLKWGGHIEGVDSAEKKRTYGGGERGKRRRSGWSVKERYQRHKGHGLADCKNHTTFTESARMEGGVKDHYKRGVAPCD